LDQMLQVRNNGNGREGWKGRILSFPINIDKFRTFFSLIVVLVLSQWFKEAIDREILGTTATGHDF
jgi:hypothetical protein